MQPVPRDGETLGEVMFRGNVVMKGYLKNKAATQAAFAGGWFHSGDLGVMHPDGYIQLKDRSKDIIISGGENISSIEVEDALYKHPAVLVVAVVAKPDEKWGETPCAFVELKPGATATAEELIAWCREHLAVLQMPAHIVFAEIPKTSTGKNAEVQAARDGEGDVKFRPSARSAKCARTTKWTWRRTPARPRSRGRTTGRFTDYRLVDESVLPAAARSRPLRAIFFA